MQKSYFIEEQRFTQPWIWIIIIVSLSVALIPMIVGLYVQLVQGKPYGTNPTSDKTLLIIFFVFSAISAGIMVLFWKTRLISEVKKDGIYIRFIPFFFKPKIFSGDTIGKYYIREYKALREYGGWGIRHGLGKHGKAYNVRGKKGMQLVFKNGKRLLIGTQRRDAFLRAMNKMMREEEEYG
jgi:hypothetical protein